MSIVLAFAGGTLAGATAAVIAVGAILVARGGRGHETGSGSDPDQVDATWTVDPERLATEIHQLALPAPDPTTPAVAIDDAGAYYPPVDRKPHVCEPKPLGPIPASMLAMLEEALDAIGRADDANWVVRGLYNELHDSAVGYGHVPGLALADQVALANQLQAHVESAWAAFAVAHKAHAATTAQFTGQWAAIHPRPAYAATDAATVPRTPEVRCVGGPVDWPTGDHNDPCGWTAPFTDRVDLAEPCPRCGGQVEPVQLSEVRR